MWAQKGFLFLPFQFITYVPAMVYTGQYSLGGITLTIPAVVGFQALYVLILYGVSEILYRRGIKRFAGVGV